MALDVAVDDFECEAVARAVEREPVPMPVPVRDDVELDELLPCDVEFPVVKFPGLSAAAVVEAEDLVCDHGAVSMKRRNERHGAPHHEYDNYHDELLER